MKQIKVKELPVDYFVTDKHHQSGNVGFINVDVEKESIGWSEERDCFVYENDDWADINFEEVQRLFGLGTKHIQLIAANQRISTIYKGEFPEYYFADAFGNEIFEGADVEKAVGIEMGGKDFFIYKVSEEK